MIKDDGFTLCKPQDPLDIWVDGAGVHMHAGYLDNIKWWLEDALKEVQQKMDAIG